MTETPTPTDPLVNKLVEKIDNLTTADIQCLCCGETNWKPVPYLLLLPFFTDPESAPDAEPLASVRTLAIICRKCGYMRLHSVSWDAE